MRIADLPETGPVACDQCGATDHEMWVERFGCDRCKGSQAVAARFLRMQIEADSERRTRGLPNRAE